MKQLESEIERLQSFISSNEETIRQQGKTISSQQEAISQLADQCRDRSARLNDIQGSLMEYFAALSCTATALDQNRIKVLQMQIAGFSLSAHLEKNRQENQPYIGKPPF